MSRSGTIKIMIKESIYVFSIEVYYILFRLLYEYVQLIHYLIMIPYCLCIKITMFFIWL